MQHGIQRHHCLVILVQHINIANHLAMVWITIYYLTLFSTASSFFLLQYATLRLPSAKVMAYSYLTPAWVMLWEIGFGCLLPPAPVLLGIGATVIALLMLLRNEN